MILVGDCRELLAGLPERSVQTCVTSPPYFALRDYGHDGQIGLEPTPDEFVAALVEVFRGVRRVLRDDGTVWLNLGDSYAGSWGNQGRKAERGTQRPVNGEMLTPVHDGRFPDAGSNTGAIPPGADYKAKDLLGIPWMVAFALRADGWYLRSEIIWAKRNCMPESVTDRPTKAHEQIFLLSKRPTYFYDADAIREPHTDSNGSRDAAQRRHGTTASGDRVAGALLDESPYAKQHKDRGLPGVGTTFAGWDAAGRNKRSVWTVATQPFPGAHFATFPPKLIEPCILAGTSPKACGVCGAPWRRVVERTTVRERLSANGDAHVSGKDVALREQGSRNDDLNFSNSHNISRTPEVRTVGWELSCTHDDDTGSCVVLDPFTGSGTTGVVCGWHGREFIGCDLNPEYAAMAEARIALEGRPGGKPAHHEPAVIVAEQMGLL